MVKHKKWYQMYLGSSISNYVITIQSFLLDQKPNFSRCITECNTNGINYKHGEQLHSEEQKLCHDTEEHF